MCKLPVALNFVLLLSSVCCGQQPLAKQQVDDSLMANGQQIQPAGETVAFDGRPVDVKLGPDSKYIFAKDRNALRIIDTDSMTVVQTISSPDGASQYGLAVSRSGDVYFTNSKNGHSRVFAQKSRDRQTAVSACSRQFELPPTRFPAAYTLKRRKNGLCLPFEKEHRCACGTGDRKNQPNPRRRCGTL